MIDLAYFVGALVVAGGLGAGILRVGRAIPEDARDALVAMLAVGLGGWGTIGLGLAALEWLRPGVILPIAVLSLALGGREVWRAGARVLARGGWNPRVMAAPAVTLLAMGLALLAPVVTGDQTKYQLAYPKLYAEAGGLVATPWTFWGHQQFLLNFLFAVAYAVRGETLALLLSAVWLALTAAAVARLVDRYLWRGVGGVAAALVVTTPIAWSLTTKAGADLALVACTTLAVTAFLEWRRGERTGPLIRCALLSGFAAGTKVMGLLTPGLLGVSLVLARRRGGGWRTRGRSVMLFGALAIAVAAPPYVRNLVETGNPLHPFAARIFPSRHWSVDAADYLAEYYRQYQTGRAQRRGGVPYRTLEVLRFPWDLTMTPESFERAARQSLDVGPFALAFLPAAVWLAWRHRAAAWVLGIGVAYVAVIASGAWAHPRYVLPGVILVLACGVAGARRLARRWFAPLVTVTLLGHLVVTTRLALPLLGEQWRVCAGTLSREQYLERHSSRYRFWRRACPIVGTTGTVLVLEKIPHPYFVSCRFVLGSYLEQTLVDYRTLRAPGDLSAAARRLGVTHVAVAQPDLARQADPYEERVTMLWQHWTDGLGSPALEVAPYALYVLPRRVETTP